MAHGSKIYSFSITWGNSVVHTVDFTATTVINCQNEVITAPNSVPQITHEGLDGAVTYTLPAFTSTDPTHCPVAHAIDNLPSETTLGGTDLTIALISNSVVENHGVGGLKTYIYRGTIHLNTQPAGAATVNLQI